MAAQDHRLARLSDRQRALRKLAVGWKALAVVIALYPALPWFLGFTGGIVNCMPLTPLAYASGIFLVGLGAFWCGIWLRVVNGAASVLAYQAVCGAAFGIWFLVASLPIQLCSDEAIGLPAVLAILIATCGITALVFVLYQRKRIRRLIQINPASFDLDNSRLWILRPVRRPDGDTRPVIELMAFGGLIGVFIGGLSLTDVLHVNLTIRSFGTAFVFWFVAYFFVGFLGFGQFYLAWWLMEVGRRSGQPILVAELMDP